MRWRQVSWFVWRLFVHHHVARHWHGQQNHRYSPATCGRTVRSPSFCDSGQLLFSPPCFYFTLSSLFPPHTSRYSVADCYVSVCWSRLSVTEGWEKWQGENKCLPFLFLLKFSSNKLAAFENYLIPRSLGEIDIVNMSTREFCILRTRVLKPESVSSRLSCHEPH